MPRSFLVTRAGRPRLSPGEHRPPLSTSDNHQPPVTIFNYQPMETRDSHQRIESTDNHQQRETTDNHFKPLKEFNQPSASWSVCQQSSVVDHHPNDTQNSLAPSSSHPDKQFLLPTVVRCNQTQVASGSSQAPQNHQTINQPSQISEQSLGTHGLSESQRSLDFPSRDDTCITELAVDDNNNETRTEALFPCPCLSSSTKTSTKDQQKINQDFAIPDILTTNQDLAQFQTLTTNQALAPPQTLTTNQDLAPPQSLTTNQPLVPPLSLTTNQPLAPPQILPTNQTLAPPQTLTTNQTFAPFQKYLGIDLVVEKQKDYSFDQSRPATTQVDKIFSKTRFLVSGMQEMSPPSAMARCINATLEQNASLSDSIARRLIFQDPLSPTPELLVDYSRTDDPGSTVRDTHETSAFTSCHHSETPPSLSPRFFPRKRSFTSKFSAFPESSDRNSKVSICHSDTLSLTPLANDSKPDARKLLPQSTECSEKPTLHFPKSRRHPSCSDQELCIQPRCLDVSYFSSLNTRRESPHVTNKFTSSAYNFSNVKEKHNKRESAICDLSTKLNYTEVNLVRKSEFKSESFSVKGETNSSKEEDSEAMKKSETEIKFPKTISKSFMIDSILNDINLGMKSTVKSLSQNGLIEIAEQGLNQNSSNKTNESTYLSDSLVDTKDGSTCSDLSEQCISSTNKLNRTRGSNYKNWRLTKSNIPRPAFSDPYRRVNVPSQAQTGKFKQRCDITHKDKLKQNFSRVRLPSIDINCPIIKYHNLNRIPESNSYYSGSIYTSPNNFYRQSHKGLPLINETLIKSPNFETPLHQTNSHFKDYRIAASDFCELNKILPVPWIHTDLYKTVFSKNLYRNHFQDMHGSHDTGTLPSQRLFICDPSIYTRVAPVVYTGVIPAGYKVETPEDYNLNSSDPNSYSSRRQPTHLTHSADSTDALLNSALPPSHHHVTSKCRTGMSSKLGHRHSSSGKLGPAEFSESKTFKLLLEQRHMKLELVNGGNGIKNPQLTSSFQDADEIEGSSCPVCGLTFDLTKHLQKHLKSHREVKRYLCSFCGKGFNDTFDLKRHTRTHTGVRPYKCGQCDKAFTQRCSLESHSKKIHGVLAPLAYNERRTKLYVCEMCGHSTDMAEDHYGHLQQMHSGTTPSVNLD